MDRNSRINRLTNNAMKQRPSSALVAGSPSSASWRCRRSAGWLWLRGTACTSGLVRQIKVLPDQAPDCIVMKTIADSVHSWLSEPTDAKPSRSTIFMQLTHYHRAYLGEPGGLPVLKEIHCYGWSLLRRTARRTVGDLAELGWDWRFVVLERPHDRRGEYGTTAALPGRVPQVLRLDAGWPGGRTIAGEIRSQPRRAGH